MLTQKDRQTLDLGINSGVAHSTHLGALISNTTSTVKCIYDYSKVGGAIGSYNLKDDEGNDVVIPSGALITSAFAFVKAAATSGGLATLALASEGAADLLGATAVASFSLSAKIAGIPDFATVADYVLLTADRKIALSVAVAALTAGKVYVYVSYVLT